MEIYSFITGYRTDQLTGNKVPIVDRRQVIAANKEAVFLQAFVLARPAVEVIQWNEGAKEMWFKKVLKGINERRVN